VATQIELERAGADSRAPLSRLFADWLYAFMREYCFRDDTDRIDAALWPDGAPAPGTRVLDIGCGPGTYTRRLAERHAGLSAIGVDRSQRQLTRARHHARRSGVDNCRFLLGDALRLPIADSTVDAAVASRLLMVLDDPERALAEIFRVLRPGGRCFIAEPRPGLRTTLPTMAMRLVEGAPGSMFDLPGAFDDDATWAALIGTQAWSSAITSGDGRYRYAECERPRR